MSTACVSGPRALRRAHADRFLARVLAALLLGLTTARAAEAVWTLPATLAAKGESWPGPWRYQTGDDPAWREPAFDDSAWPLGSAAEVPLRWRNGGWAGRGWFRLRLDASKFSQRTPLLLIFEQAGASEIYLDGRLLSTVGNPGTGYADEVALFRSETPPQLVFEPGSTHVLAVRYTNFYAQPLQRIQPNRGGLTLNLASYGEWTREWLVADHASYGLLMFFMAVPLLLAAIHFSLFAFLPRSPDNLYCGLFMCALSFLTFTRIQLDRVTEVADYLHAHRLFLMAIVAFSLFCLLTVYATFARSRRGLFRGFLAAGLVLLVWPFFDESQLSFRLCAAYGFIVSLEAVRVTFLALREGRDGAGLVLSGIALFGLAVLYNALRIFNVVSDRAYSGHTINFGILAAAMGMSLFISRNYALTTRRLERKLEEVEELSARNLAQEREKQAIIAAQNERLEIQVRERTQELSSEKEKSDQLLANILPHGIAAELKATGTSAPRRFEEVTILFCDFSGFTSTVSAIPAHRLIKELNEIFRVFDDIVDREGLEKIKTIGDAYMAAGGLPEACPDHAQRAVRAALAMQASIEARNVDAAIKWRMRVGLHAGPVVAGVVGKRKFTFDVFGDTVNLASRMETSAEPGQINLSAYAYDLVREDFRCDYRGKIEIKGKGELDIYTVRGPRIPAATS